MKKLFAGLVTLMAFAAAVIFAGCSNPSSSSASSSDVPKGSVITATYSGGGRTRIVFDADSTVTFYDNGSVSDRAVVSEDKICASGTYVVTADNFAQITIERVLRDWGIISKSDLNKYKDQEFAIKVAFSGNDLRITFEENEEKQLSFSTDNKNVSKPSGGSLFSNGPVDATYLFRVTLKLENGNFISTGNIYFDDIGLTVRGTYTESNGKIIFTDSTIFGGDDTTEETAIISGDTLTLTTVDSSGSDVEIFKKRGSSGKEWECLKEIKLSSNGDVKYYENDKLCWEGTYTIIDDETASVKLNKTHVSGSFGTAPGSLYIELFIENGQEFLGLDLINNGGVCIFFAREK
ncbi:MAG: hypothetical protein K2I95_08330 [Treponemataceae bacterium]|nr:hypothetical protein [Treponemataceae bacterium]